MLISKAVVCLAFVMMLGCSLVPLLMDYKEKEGI